jgi:uncharacterized RDD family membrane protein YckC
MFCPRCGREALSGAAFCVQCGAALDAPLTGSPALEPPPISPMATPMVGAPAAALAQAPAVVRYGGFWRRFWAFWIDGILLWLAGSLLQVGMGVSLFERDFTDPRTLFSNFLTMLMGWLYCAFLESSARQATLGQMVIGIKVTDLQLRRVSFARATGRHFGQILSAVILLMGFVMIAFTEKKQGLHDMLAGCLVIRAAD